MDRVEYVETRVSKFSCPNCHFLNVYEEGVEAVDKKIVGKWATGTNKEVTLNDTKVKLVELICLRCGTVFIRLSPDTPESIAKTYEGIKMKIENRSVPTIVKVEEPKVEIKKEEVKEVKIEEQGESKNDGKQGTDSGKSGKFWSKK